MSLLLSWARASFREVAPSWRVETPESAEMRPFVSSVLPAVSLLMPETRMPDLSFSSVRPLKSWDEPEMS